MKRATGAIFGFLLIAVGLLSIILDMVGMEFTYLAWLDVLGPLAAFVIKLIMVLVGFVLMYLSLTNWRNAEDLRPPSAHS